MTDTNIAPQCSLTPDQVRRISELTRGGEGDYYRGYQFITDEIHAGRISVDHDTQYWFEHAIEINSNDPNSAANAYIRGVSAYGLQWDGQAGDLQEISNRIGTAVINDIIESHSIRQFDYIFQHDAHTALAPDNPSLPHLTLGGWGGASYYWNTPIVMPNTTRPTTIGGYILSHPDEYEKFIAVNAAAFRRTLFSELEPGQLLHGETEISGMADFFLGSQLPLSIQMEIVDRALSTTAGQSYADPSHINGWDYRDGQWVRLQEGPNPTLRTAPPETAAQLDAIRAIRLPHEERARFSEVDHSLDRYSLMAAATVDQLAHDLGLTTTQLFDIPGNQQFAQRNLRDPFNGNNYFIFNDSELMYTNRLGADGNPSYVILRNGTLDYNSVLESLGRDLALPVDNSRLDFQTNLSPTSNNVADTSNDWQHGTALSGGDYRAMTPIDVLNGNGFTNTEPSRYVTDDLRPGAHELVNNMLSNSIDSLLNDVYRNQTYGTREMTPMPSEVASFGRLSGLYLDAPHLINVDPLVVDLNGDGVRLISYQDSRVAFNVDNDPYIENTGWVSAADGIVVHDRNGDGRINDITETLSEYYTPAAVDGLSALATLDSNHDNVFDSRDTMWKTLRVWQDVNSDGITDAGELKTFEQLHIQAIDLHAAVQRHETLAGNPVLSRSTMHMSDGSTREVAAVDFATNPVGYEWNNVLEGSTIHFEHSTTASFVIGSTTGQTASTAEHRVNTLIGNRGNDRLIGDDQANWLIGAGGNDSLQAGGGDDFLVIDADDDLSQIDTGDGFDNVRVADDRAVTIHLNQLHAEVLQSGSGNDLLISGATYNTFISGGAGDDNIIGGAADDALAGEDGDDFIDGGLGDDIIRGHRGVDRLVGGLGNDYLDGGVDDDYIYGGEGDDVLIGGQGADRLFGGAGFDMAEYKSSYANFTVARTDYGFLVTDLRSQEQDRLYGIEKIRFADMAMNVDESDTAPVGVRDDLTITGNTAITIAANQLLANDWNLHNERLHIGEICNAVGGTAVLLESGDVRFTPDPYAIGTASFDYLVRDEHDTYSLVYLNHDINNSAPMLTRVNLHRNDSPSDPLFFNQWYFYKIRLGDLWQEYTGRGIQVGVFEVSAGNPFDFHHPDLEDNTSALTRSTFATTSDYSRHATLVAGVIAAERNGEGSIGIAYDATLSFHGISDDGKTFLINNVDGLRNLTQYDIANNSWDFTQSFYDNINNINNAESQELRICLEAAAGHGRQGLGTIVVQAAGNDRRIGDNVNYHSLLNSRYNITVASVNQEGDLSHFVAPSTPFSTPGAAILISAPGSNIRSTSVAMTNANGTVFDEDYAKTSGTSFSTPIVSGIAALMLQANPHLGFRDVQKILAYSARRVEDPNTQWHFNGATTANGGGLAYSPDYGFGLVDAHAAVRLAESWDSTHTLSNERQVTVNNHWNTTIPDNNSAVSVVSVSEGIAVEYAEVKLNFHHAHIQDWIITLISPDGSESQLLARPIPQRPQGSGVMEYLIDNNHYEVTLSSANFYGESGQGNWTLRVQDTATGEVGTISDWQLTLYGSDDDGNDNYIFTDSLGQTDQGNHVIRDNRGIDTLNAAAILDAVSLDLRQGATSHINGQDIRLSTATPTPELAQAHAARQREFAEKQQELADKQQQLAAARQAILDDTERSRQVRAEYDVWSNKRPDISLDVINAKRDELERLAAELNRYDWIAVQGGDRPYAYRDHSNNHVLHYTQQEHDQFQARRHHALDLQDEYHAMVDSYNSQVNTIRARSQQLADEFNHLYDEINTSLPARIATLQQQIPQLQQQVSNLRVALDTAGQEDTVIENAIGGDGNDILIGNDLANILVDGRGSDTLTGGVGADRFKITRHAGDRDVITDFNPAQADERIDLSDFALPSFSALSMTAQGTDVVIHLDQQTLTLRNVALADLRATHFTGLLDEQVTLNGTAAADVLFGDARDTQINAGAGNDEIHAGIGNNRLSGGDGDDSFVIARHANGNDTISDLQAGDSIDLSVFAELRNFGDLQRVQQGNDVAITLADNQRLVIENSNLTALTPDYFIFNGAVFGSHGSDLMMGTLLHDVSYGLEGDDLIWGNGYEDSLFGGPGNDMLDGGHGDDIVCGGQGNDECYGGDGNDQLYAGAGDDRLNGGNGNDMLDGGAGNDLLAGGVGSDTYLFGRGSGVDTIVEANNSDTDVLAVGIGITQEQLWLRAVGSDLEISIIGTADKVTVVDWYSPSPSRVEQFRMANGHTLLDTQVDTLVSAMATFAPPAGGQTTLPPDYQAALNPVIAANWG